MKKTPTKLEQLNNSLDCLRKAEKLCAKANNINCNTGDVLQAIISHIFTLEDKIARHHQIIESLKN